MPNAPKITRRDVLRWGATLPLALLLTATFPLAALAKTSSKKSSAAKITPTPAKKPRAPRLLMIDPGHGGNDPGAVGKKGMQEKEITLDIARRMEAVLKPENSVQARLTRDRDEYLPLKERVKIGREAGADLFVSIHADSAPNALARGLSCYTLSEKASDRFAEQLAEKENYADVIGGVDLSEADQEVAAILYDLSERRTRNTAQRVKISFVKAMGRKWRLLDRPMRSANFAVLRAPDVPSILVETGFLSNPKDEALLCQAKQRQMIAELMAREITAILASPLFG